jgi:hypothetical protein
LPTSNCLVLTGFHWCIKNFLQWYCNIFCSLSSILGIFGLDLRILFLLIFQGVLVYSYYQI